MSDTLTPKEIAVLRALQKDSGRQRKAIAYELGITESNLSKVVADLRARGYIRKIAAIIDPKKVGCDGVSFYQVEFESFAALEKAEEALAARPEVQEIYNTTKGLELFIKVRGAMDKLIKFKATFGGMGVVGRVHMITTPLIVKSETDLPI